MKKTLLIPTLLLTCSSILAQPIITNAEDFAIGTVLKFQKCNPSSISVGNAGANQTWNFSGLSILPDTSTEWMLDPSMTSMGHLFPTANLVVKVSNGQYTYLEKTVNDNNIMGFIDTTLSFPATHYTNPMLIAKRPLSYGTIIKDTFMLAGSSAIGIVTISPDAYGTLILPNGTHNNVLRVKISQVHPWFTYTIYVWFNGITKSALLKVDNQSNVEYLLGEMTIGITEINEHMPFRFYPNPTRNKFQFESESNGELSIVNSLGQIAGRFSIEDTETAISTVDFSPGVYHLIFKIGNNISTSRIIIQ